MSMLVTNPPTTNWPTPSGKEIAVLTVVLRADVITYSNETGLVQTTNYYQHLLIPKKYILKEEWVEAPVDVWTPPPNVLRPPPLPQHR